MPQEFSIEEPVLKTSLSSIVAGKIIQAINKGKLKRGDRLPSVSELAKELNVGQSSVREALKELQLTGVVDIRHGKGIFVSEVDIGSVLKDLSHLLILKKPDILYLMEARKIVEYGTVRLAAQRASQEDLKELYQLIQRMQSELDEPENFIKDDLDFHLKLAEASKNPILPTFLNSIRNLFLQEQEVVVRLPSAAERASKYHMRIYEAVKDRDVEKAVRMVEEHLIDIEKAISKYFNKSVDNKSSQLETNSKEKTNKDRKLKS